MTEISRSNVFNRSPARTARYAAAAGILVLAGVTENSCSTGGGVVEQVPSIVHFASSDSVLDCVDYYTKDPNGQIVRDSDEAWPRMIAFTSDPGTLWAGEIRVEYGVRVTDAETKGYDMRLSKVKISAFWLAEKNTGEEATTTYASGNSALPNDNQTWENQLKIPVGLDQGRLPDVGTNSITGGLKVTVAQIAPYYEDNVYGAPSTFHYEQSVAIQCNDADNNVPTDNQSKIYWGQVYVDHVPDSTYETVPPAQS